MGAELGTGHTRRAAAGLRPPSPHAVLLEVLDGGGTLSVRGDEAERAWQVVTPTLEITAAGEPRCWSTRRAPPALHR